jgi:hypothetical protein
MVSEDSDQLYSGLLAIHRLSDLDDLNQPFSGQMMTGFDQLYTSCKLSEVFLLRSVHGILPEEWNDDFQQILPPSDDETIQVFFVVVVPGVDQDLTQSKELTQFVETGNAFRTLCDRKFVRDLVASLVAFSVCPAGLPDETDGEASFPVYKTNNPAKLNQPFLLIVRTHHVVTHLSVGSVGYSGFPAYGRMLSPPLLTSRATKCYLRQYPLMSP